MVVSYWTGEDEIVLLNGRSAIGILRLPSPYLSEKGRVDHFIEIPPSFIDLINIINKVGNEDTGHNISVPIDIEVTPVSSSRQTPICHDSLIPEIDVIIPPSLMAQTFR